MERIYNFLKEAEVYDENDDNTQVLYFNGGVATFSAFGQPDEVVEF